jgi:glycosyltransferase involved in cell wall biosynthesis
MKKITFATNPGAGSLEYVKLLIESLKNNLDYKEHEILIFVDRDTDGLVDYLKSEKQNFHDLKIVTHSVKPVISYQRNSSLIVDLAKHDIISYLHSDMVISKGYDTAVINELEENTVLSSTRIEPPLHPESPTTFTQDFGLNPEDFEFESFIKYAETIKSNKSINYFFAPYTFHKETWNKLGGYDTMFRRSREDSDFVQRCLHAGIKLKQTYAANVYHFTCVTSRGKNWFDESNQVAQDRVQSQNYADQIEIRRFFKKWGSFNHGENLMKKYDCDLVIKRSKNRLNIAYQLEPFFTRVFVESQDCVDRLLQAHKNEHEPANRLLNFTEQDWQESSKYYNQIDYSQIYFAGEPENYNVKIIVDLDSTEYNFLTQETLLNLSHLIQQTEHGDYESGNCILSIKEKVDITPPFKVENPPFDMSLLTIE